MDTNFLDSEFGLDEFGNFINLPMNNLDNMNNADMPDGVQEDVSDGLDGTVFPQHVAAAPGKLFRSAPSSAPVGMSRSADDFDLITQPCQDLHLITPNNLIRFLPSRIASCQTQDTDSRLRPQMPRTSPLSTRP